jgi:ribosomal protein S18 acetylase RimI-like enzyme
LQVERPTPIHSNYQYAYLQLDPAKSQFREEGYSRLALDGAAARAFVSARPLDWDSEVFGVPCARIDLLWAADAEALPLLEDLLADCLLAMERDAVALCDVRIGLHDLRLVHLVERQGFRLMDVLNIYLSEASLPDPGKSFGGYSIVDEPARLGPAKEDVRALASTAFSHSRLYNDAHIPKEKADLFYEKLVDAFLQRDKNTLQVALDEEQKPAAFSISLEEEELPLDDAFSYLWLISVSPAHARKGLGQFLLHSTLHELHKTSKYVEIGTQINNGPANKIYARAKLPLVANLATFHRWSAS